MKKIFLFLILFFGMVNVVWADNIDNPTIYSQPIIKWGDSSFHDSLGARDPFVVKDNGVYYLYYDGTEDLLNPSFESNLGNNGWDTWQATAVSTTEKKLFGERSLKVINSGVVGGGVHTGNYYFGDKTEANLAMPAGLEVTPNTVYIASVWVWVEQNNTAQIIVRQFKDDPYGNHAENVISDRTTSSSVAGNGGWQRVFTKFTTGASTTAIVIYFTSGLNQTTYWDGVQLERIEANINGPSDFPTDQKYNEKIEDTIGWRSCLAISTDGVNFTKKGQISIVGAKGDWENNERPGRVGVSGNYMSPFYYQGYWYSYLWVAGYQLGADFNTKDPGYLNHQKWYGDRRAFLPNGQARSGLVRSTSLLGPFERMSQAGPQVIPNSDWGQIYVTANGVPQKVNDQWVLFLAGAPGTTWTNSRMWTTISPGLATGDSPLGPWTVTSYSPILPDDLEGQVPEGPIYYKDSSGTHFMFINDIRDGSVDAYWANDPLGKWMSTNRKTIVDNLSGVKGLATVVEKDSNNLLVYFATRPYSGTSNGWKQYLFHDIGLTTISLPLIGSKSGDFNRDNVVNLVDFGIWKSKYLSGQMTLAEFAQWKMAYLVN